MSDDEFQAFYEEHGRRLWAYIVRLTGDPPVADDLVQETFMRMLNIDRLDAMTPEHRKNYLYKTAANLVRKRFRETRHEELSDLHLESQAQPDEALAIRRALNQMKSPERSLLWLAYVEGFSHREVAKILGYREGSVRPLLHRAKRKLLDLLGTGGD